MASLYFEREYTAAEVLDLRREDSERVYLDHNSSLPCLCVGCKAVRDRAAELDCA